MRRQAWVVWLIGCGGSPPPSAVTPSPTRDEPVEARCETERTVTSDLVIERHISFDHRGLAFRDVQIRNGKVHHTEWIQRDSAGRPIAISSRSSTIVFRYGDHGELVRRGDGSSDALLVWKGRFFDVPPVSNPMWSASDLPEDLPKDVGVGFNGEVTADYGIRSRVDHWIYDEHGRIIQALKDDGEHRYTWNEDNELVRDDWTYDGSRVEITMRYENHVVVEAITRRNGVEELAVRFDDRGRPTEARRFGKIIERSTWTDGCPPVK